MARTTQPTFGTRQNKPKPVTLPGDAPEGSFRVDWKLVTLIAVVFVGAFVWLF